MTNSNKDSNVRGLCSSDILILPDEQQSDLEKIERGWLEEYQPEGHAEETLVTEIILNEWALKRARRRLMFAEQDAVEEWNKETENHLKLMQRTKTAAERSFYQALNAMQRFRKDRIQMAEKLDKLMNRNQQLERELAEFKKEKDSKLPLGDITNVHPFRMLGSDTDPHTARRGQSHPKKPRKLSVLEQWVEVTIENGKTVTRLFPPNDQMMKRGRKMQQPPELVYRRLNFPNGVPEEYAWASSDLVKRGRGGMGIQRMTLDTWLEVIEREKVSEEGHVGPTGQGNLPRPSSRGECECSVCTGNRALLEAAGLSW